MPARSAAAWLSVDTRISSMTLFSIVYPAQFPGDFEHLGIVALLQRSPKPLKSLASLRRDFASLGMLAGFSLLFLSRPYALQNLLSLMARYGPRGSCQGAV